MRRIGLLGLALALLLLAPTAALATWSVIAVDRESGSGDHRLGHLRSVVGRPHGGPDPRRVLCSQRFAGRGTAGRHT